MKKKVLILIILILVIIGIIYGINKFNDSKINYEIVSVNAYNYVQFYENEQYGVIDREGNIVIPNPEKDLFICYTENDDTKILNSNKDELFTGYDKVEPIKLKNTATILCYEKSVLKYEKDGLYGLVDFEGKEITKNVYNSIDNLQSTEGKFLVSEDNKYGVINLKGKALVKLEYDNIISDGYYTEENGYAKSGFIISNTTDDGYKYGYVDYKGKKILDTNYDDLIRITNLEDIYIIASDNGKYGLFKKSKEVINPDYQSIIYDENGLLIIQKNKNYGLADLNGTIKVEPNYTSIESRGIYFYASNKDEKVVFDSSANRVDMNFNKCLYKTENDNYLISTVENNNITYYGIENSSGTVLVNSKYRYIEYAFEDLFIAKDEKGKLGIINSNDNTRLDFKYDVLQKINDKNIFEVIDEDNKTYIYSSDLSLSCEMEDAIIDSQENSIKVYNDKEEKYFDNNGEEISEDSDIVKNGLLKSFPTTIGDYTRRQYSLDSIYYVKDKSEK